MKKIAYYLVAACAFVGMTSCEENKMEVYNDTPALYFKNVKSGTDAQADSINHSFFIYDEDVTVDTAWVTINTMGFPENIDRPIKIVQTNVGEPLAAVAGTHFVSLDDSSLKDYYCIPAGKVSTKIPVVLLRDKSLSFDQYRLELTIEQNEYFRPGIDAWRNFIITTTDLAVKPAMWDRMWKYYFGSSWGSVKMRFIITSTGLTDFDTYPSDYAYLQWLSGTAKQALIVYNANHPDAPLCEADGSPVTFD